MLGALLHLFSTEGEIHLYLGEWAAAAEVFQRGLALAEELGNLERQAGYRAGLALVARNQHNREGAIALLEEALTLITELGYWHLRTRIQLWLAEALLLHGRINEAEAHLDTALETAQSHARTLLLLQGERLQARLLAFAKTLEHAARLGLSLEIARTQAACGETALLYAPSPHDGYALLAQARKILIVHDARAELRALAVAAEL